MNTMKLTKYLVSSVAAVAVAGTLSLAYAQTTTQGTSNAPVKGDLNRTTTPGMTNNGTAATGTKNSQGTATTNLRADGTTGTNRNPDGTLMRRADGSTGTNLNSDGTMSTERVARADRG